LKITNARRLKQTVDNATQDVAAGAPEGVALQAVAPQIRNCVWPVETELTFGEVDHRLLGDGHVERRRIIDIDAADTVDECPNIGEIDDRDVVHGHAVVPLKGVDQTRGSVTAYLPPAKPGDWSDREKRNHV
jgi:hypothetical protein